MPKKAMGNNTSEKRPSEKDKNGKLRLDEAIVALQKSFSRVSAKSAEISQEKARAMVTGQVTFEMSLKVQPEKDYLYIDSNGTVDLRLSGMIDTDIRTVEE